MAGSGLVQELQLAVTCSICTQYMEVPVTLDCGHNYCQACILRYWDRVEEEEEDPKQCPQCRRSFRQRSFRPNKLLAKVTAIAKRFPSQDEAQDVRCRSSPLGGVEPMGQDPQGQQGSIQTPVILTPTVTVLQHGANVTGPRALTFVTPLSRV
ncbi:protein deglycase DJ-1 [Platysternon megacephalum]|uniref:Protein deglycase DJ-1 n=1 Tax=Platysternon megacephalum TaxID=55544 RepID=A0A4D9DNJ6_9SAUR|nr:protein deglycase DJ-1 [Platysternon megacephalum]